MSTGATTTGGVRDGAPAASRWIVSARYDLTYFIGSCVVTWLFLGLYHLLALAKSAPPGAAILVTYFVYTAFFDQPHIFQTFSRTHADPVERRRRWWLHGWLLGAYLAAGVVIVAVGWEARLIVFAAIFGSFHIVRQHWGFLKAYQGLNGDRAPIDGWLDAATFYLGMTAFLVHDYTGQSERSVIFGDLHASFPSAPPWLAIGLKVAFALALAAFLARQLWRGFRGPRPNWPKLALMGAALSTHGLVFQFTATPFLVAEALETAYHDVQYHGWMAHYQHRKARDRRAPARWFLLALAYGVVVGVLELVAFLDGRVSWLFVPFAMVVLWHYTVDGFIWRFRHEPELRALMLTKEPAADPAPVAGTAPAPAE